MEAMSQSCMTIITTSLSPTTHQILAPVKAIPHLNARKQKPFAAARCVASGSGYAAAVEPITPEEEEELTQRRRICGGEANRGMWELLECLEKEAIMGDDDGRDPKDYNRRAKIFDKSSKIFKNIKEQRDDHSPDGVSFYGPIWDHVLSYWRGSLEDPSHVLFMKYEEMKEEPCVQLKRLAEFLGCPFTEEEEESGGVEKILELCSLPSLSDLEINRTGKTSNGVDYKFYFRKGEVGDSTNHLTPEMESKIDMIIEEKLKGSGLSF